MARMSCIGLLFQSVMPGLVPGTHVLLDACKDVDGRDKPGHDESIAGRYDNTVFAYSAGLAAAAARSAATRFSTMRTDQTEPS
jgi:hypothetical protein